MRIRVGTTAVALAAAGALALTGCGSSGSGSQNSGSNGGLGGSSSGGSGNGSGKTYKIGFEGDLSSPNKQLGINEINAVNLAVEQANASGKFSVKFSVNSQDDGGTKASAPPSAAKLVQDTAVVGVVGPAFSGPTQANGTTYAQAGLALISPSATDETLTSSGYTTFHRIVPTDAIEGKSTADYIAKTNKSVFVADDQSTYGKGVGDVVRRELAAKNVKVSSQSIAATATDLSALAQAIKSSGATAMYYGGYYAQAGLLAKALNAVGYKGLEISGNGAKDPQFTKIAGSAGNGYYFACGCLDATTAANAAAFTKAYTAKFNTPPSTYSPEAFDAANALMTAIDAAAKAGSVTRATVEAQVNKLDYQGITTTVKFQSNGEVAQATINLYADKNNKVVLLGDISKQ